MRKLKRDRPTIGVIAGWETYTGKIHSFLDYVYRGAQAAARELECNLIIGCGVSSHMAPAGRPAWPFILDDNDFVPVGPWNTDGLVVAAPILNPSAMQYFLSLVEQGFPLVFAGDREAGPSVIVDNESGIHQAIDHLVMHGHRRIAFIAGYQHEGGDSSARLRGYLSGLKKHHLPYDPNLVTYGFHNPAVSYQAMQGIISRGAPFTAVIASNDDAAAGVMNALHDAGLVVPQDIAVIGFDDRMEARAQIPLLTTVHHPMFELGHQSIELLYRIIQGSDPRDSVVSIPTHLVVRESCGCLPGTEDYKDDAKGDGKENAKDSPNSRANTGQLRSSRAPAMVDVPVSIRKDPLGEREASKQLIFEPFPSSSPFPLSSLNASIETARVSQAMADAVYKELRRLSYREVEYLCFRLIDALQLSITHNNPTTFRQTIQQILEHIATLGDDVYAWQSAITVLKESVPELTARWSHNLPAAQVENMLHQARIAVSEVSRGQFSRLLVNQSLIADQIGLMTSRLFIAQTEEEVFKVFAESLPGLGISSAYVAYYQPEENDPVAWSIIKTPANNNRVFTRQFPTQGLYEEGRPFQLAILPLVGPMGLFGFVAFNTLNLDNLGAIVRQLVAALRAIWLYREAVEARHTAEEANLLKSRFLSIVSHELRTPLNLIFGLSSMMLESGDCADQPEVQVNRKDLERIFIAAQHLESLIRDVLDLTSSDVKQLRLILEPLDINQLLKALSGIGEQLAVDKGLTWHAEIAADLPKVRGDSTRLRQVILNLVTNAVKFTAQGEVSLSATTKDGGILIAIRDTGIGIPPDERDIIFDEFRQSRRTTARGYGGLGLGLSICKRLVEMHGGKIGVFSTGEEGCGSTFYFTLPVMEFRPEVPPTPADLDLHWVLLIANSANDNDKLKNHLIMQGFQVEMHGVEQTDDWLNWTHPAPPDKIILNLGLNAECGWEIIKLLKDNPDLRNVPVLFCSFETEQDAGALLDLNFLTKPLSTTELADAIVTRGVLEEKENEKRARSILIVDDDPEVLDLHTRVVGTLTSDYRVKLANNGREALDLIRRERPALVLLDLMMPELDGFGVLEAMQAEELMRSIPVIVLTGQVLTEEDIARLNCGVASVLSKGMFTRQETLEHITASLKRKRRVPAEAQHLVLKAMSYIHTHFKDPISRSDIAAYVGVSERHLARCFQQEIGLSPIIYLNRFRVKMAKAFLDAGKMSITAVAMEVGFSTGGYFTRVFHDEMGISPREYLRSQAGPSKPG